MAKDTPIAREKLAAALKLAREGAPELRWLHQAVCKAGYAPASTREGEAALVTAAQLGRGLGKARRTIAEWLKNGLPVAREAHGNQPALYDVFAALAWLDGRGEGARDNKNMPKDLEDLFDEDPLLAMGQSPYNEMYRREKVREAQRANAVAEGRLIETSDVARQQAEIGTVFRGHAETLERVFGQEVARRHPGNARGGGGLMAAALQGRGAGEREAEAARAQAGQAEAQTRRREEDGKGPAEANAGRHEEEGGA